MTSADFEVIYWEHFIPCFHYASKILNNRDDAKDVCADIFTKFWTDGDKNNELISIRAYLIVCTKNACVDYIKKSRNKDQRDKVYSEQFETLEFTYADEVRAEHTKKMMDNIETLTPVPKSVIRMTLEGLKTGAIAVLLKTNPKTIKNQKSIAIKNLRNKINPS